MVRYAIAGLLAILMVGVANAEPPAGKGKGEAKDATLFVYDANGLVVGPVIWLGTDWATIEFPFDGESYAIGVTPTGVFETSGNLFFDALNCGGQAYATNNIEAFSGPDKGNVARPRLNTWRGYRVFTINGPGKTLWVQDGDLVESPSTVIRLSRTDDTYPTCLNQTDTITNAWPVRMTTFDFEVEFATPFTVGP